VAAEAVGYAIEFRAGTAVEEVVTENYFSNKLQSSMEESRSSRLEYNKSHSHIRSARGDAMAFFGLLVTATAVCRGPVVVPRRAPVVRACAAPEAPRWFVTVPRSLAGISEQAARSAISAAQAGERRMIVEAAMPELDPTTPAFKYMELLAFVEQIGLHLVESGFLPKSRPQVKLLFVNGADATLAGGVINYNNLPVSVLGAQTAMGEKDGAFILVAPRAGLGIGPAAAVEAAANAVLAAAGSRPVIVVNPRLGGASPLEKSCAPVYFVRPLTVKYLEDSTAGAAPTTILLLGLYKIFVYFEAVVNKSTIRPFSLPTCIAHPGSILLHDYWTV